MKIAVCGKGGSGKSTVAALLAREMERRGFRVVVIDSDESNSGLYRMLGFTSPPEPLMELLGGKKGVKQKMSQPNLFGESEIGIADIPERYILRRDGLFMVAIGKIMQSLEGCACPMGVLSREFLKKLKLENRELAVVDMEAGVEHFGRGVETSIDRILIVVEPPLESIEVARKIHKLATEIGVKKVLAILNKIPSEELADRLKMILQENHFQVIGSLEYDQEIFKASLEGRIPEEGSAVSEIRRIADRIVG
ncbi:MAG: P-loop NTPase [Dehalococcoidales bacterium]|jgi:CO dehydrogenase maturation factor|nr:P-loop NTPase [Dehalococcoidales bacterium]